jgi:hypothetical protein
MGIRQGLDHLDEGNEENENGCHGRIDVTRVTIGK